jgi:hypothetical protein
MFAQILNSELNVDIQFFGYSNFFIGLMLCLHPKIERDIFLELSARILKEPDLYGSTMTSNET